MIEHRSGTLTLAGNGKRAAAVAKRVGGIALPFNTITRIGGVFDERFMPGAFNVQERAGWVGGLIPSVLACYAHDLSLVIGNVAAGTLSLSQARDGLHFSIEPPAGAAWIVDGIVRGDLAGASVSFANAEDEWTMQRDGVPLRTVHAATLVEVSAVAWPAYPTATCAPLTGPQRSLPAPSAARGSAAIADEHRLLAADLKAWRVRERLLIEGGIDAREARVRRLARRPA